jgi:hypothetical protein
LGDNNSEQPEDHSARSTLCSGDVLGLTCYLLCSMTSKTLSFRNWDEDTDLYRPITSSRDSKGEEQIHVFL